MNDNNLLLSRLCWAGCIIVITASLWFRSHMIIHADLGYMLFLTHKFLNGGRYYYDFFEPNLPLIIYVYTIPVLLAKGLPFAEINIFFLYTTLLGILSVLFCANLLKGTSIYNDKPLYFILIFSICFALFLPVPTLAKNAIGDKSFFLLALILPYFLAVICENLLLPDYKSFLSDVWLV